MRKKLQITIVDAFNNFLLVLVQSLRVRVKVSSCGSAEDYPLRLEGGVLDYWTSAEHVLSPDSGGNGAASDDARRMAGSGGSDEAVSSSAASAECARAENLRNSAAAFATAVAAGTPRKASSSKEHSAAAIAAAAAQESTSTRRSAPDELGDLPRPQAPRRLPPASVLPPHVPALPISELKFKPPPFVHEEYLLPIDPHAPLGTEHDRGSGGGSSNGAAKKSGGKISGAAAGAASASSGAAANGGSGGGEEQSTVLAADRRAARAAAAAAAREEELSQGDFSSAAAFGSSALTFGSSGGTGAPFGAFSASAGATTQLSGPRRASAPVSFAGGSEAAAGSSGVSGGAQPSTTRHQRQKVGFIRWTHGPIAFSSCFECGNLASARYVQVSYPAALARHASSASNGVPYGPVIPCVLGGTGGAVPPLPKKGFPGFFAGRPERMCGEPTLSASSPLGSAAAYYSTSPLAGTSPRRRSATNFVGIAAPVDTSALLSASDGISAGASVGGSVVRAAPAVTKITLTSAPAVKTSSTLLQEPDSLKSSARAEGQRGGEANEQSPAASAARPADVDGEGMAEKRKNSKDIERLVDTMLAKNKREFDKREVARSGSDLLDFASGQSAASGESAFESPLDSDVAVNVTGVAAAARFSSALAPGSTSAAVLSSSASSSDVGSGRAPAAALRGRGSAGKDSRVDAGGEQGPDAEHQQRAVSTPSSCASRDRGDGAGSSRGEGAGNQRSGSASSSASSGRGSRARPSAAADSDAEAEGEAHLSDCVESGDESGADEDSDGEESSASGKSDVEDGVDVELGPAHGVLDRAGGTRRRKAAARKKKRRQRGQGASKNSGDSEVAPPSAKKACASKKGGSLGQTAKSSGNNSSSPKKSTHHAPHPEASNSSSPKRRKSCSDAQGGNGSPAKPSSSKDYAANPQDPSTSSCYGSGASAPGSKERSASRGPGATGVDGARRKTPRRGGGSTTGAPAGASAVVDAEDSSLGSAGSRQSTAAGKTRPSTRPTAASGAEGSGHVKSAGAPPVSGGLGASDASETRRRASDVVGSSSVSGPGLPGSAAAGRSLASATALSGAKEGSTPAKPRPMLPPWLLATDGEGRPIGALRHHGGALGSATAAGAGTAGATATGAAAGESATDAAAQAVAPEQPGTAASVGGGPQLVSEDGAVASAMAPGAATGAGGVPPLAAAPPEDPNLVAEAETHTYELALEPDTHSAWTTQWFYFACKSFSPSSEQPTKVHFRITNLRKNKSLHQLGLQPFTYFY